MCPIWRHAESLRCLDRRCCPNASIVSWSVPCFSLSYGVNTKSILVPINQTFCYRLTAFLYIWVQYKFADYIKVLYTKCTKVLLWRLYKITKRKCGSLLGTFTDDAGRASPLQHGAVLNGGNQLFVRHVALLLWRQLSVQGAGSSTGPSRGARAVVLGPGPHLGQAPSCCTAAAVGQGERTDATVQGVRGSTRTCRGMKEEGDWLNLGNKQIHLQKRTKKLRSKGMNSASKSIFLGGVASLIYLRHA